MGAGKWLGHLMFALAAASIEIALMSIRKRSGMRVPKVRIQRY